MTCTVPASTAKGVPMVTIHTGSNTRFVTGTADLHGEPILFPHGLVGCPDWRRFTFEASELPGIVLLQSLDDVGVCFTLYAISDVDTDYLLKLHPDDADTLKVLGVG